MPVSIRAVLQENLPLFAPLSEPLVLHLFEQYIKSAVINYLSTRYVEQSKNVASDVGNTKAYIWKQYIKDNISILENDFGQFEASVLGRFIGEIRRARWTIYTYMQPFIATGKIEYSSTFSSEWFIRTLQMCNPQKKLLSQQTLTDWRDKNLLKNQAYKYINLNNAAAILIARTIDTRERGWLPSTLRDDEPEWWCWRADPPCEGKRERMLPCPFPFLENVSKMSILCTPWQGATWKNDWLNLDLAAGACRWGGNPPKVSWQADRHSWGLSIFDLKFSHWCDERLALEDVAHYDMRQEQKHDFLCWILRDLAEPLLRSADQFYLSSIAPEAQPPQLTSHLKGRPSKFTLL